MCSSFSVWKTKQNLKNPLRLSDTLSGKAVDSVSGEGPLSGLSMVTFSQYSYMAERGRASLRVFLLIKAPNLSCGLHLHDLTTS